MINYTPIKILFNLSGFKIYSYGFMIGIAFLVMFFLVYNYAKKQGWDEKIIIEALIILFVSDIIGARLGYVLIHPVYFINNPGQIFAYSAEGLVSYGAYIFSLITLYIYFRIKKVSYLGFLDILAPYRILEDFFNRIGCFLNYCCYGKPSNVFWAVQVPGDVSRHPTQIYLALSALALFFLLIYIRNNTKKKPFEGYYFSLLLILYGSSRFIIDFFREYPSHYLGFAPSQFVCIGLILAGALLFYFGIRKNKNGLLKNT
jgi:phosphatidylglycerol---prolipoprotein diacylglyceryl transferase